jgi:Flp pilus assembly protein TadD
MHKGRMFERLGRPDSARAAYQTALDRGIDHPLPAARLASLHHRQNRPDDAFERAVDALRLGVSDDVPLT